MTLRCFYALLALLPLLPGCLAVENSNFSFDVTADMREFAGPEYQTSEYFLGTCEAIQDVGKGAFMVSIGDIDPPEHVHQTIKKVLGDDYIWYPVVGNHEIETNEDMVWLRQWGSGEIPHLVRRGPANCKETTYSFDYQNAHFVVLNQYYNGWSDIGDSGYEVEAIGDGKEIKLWIALGGTVLDKQVDLADEVAYEKVPTEVLSRVPELVQRAIRRELSGAIITEIDRHIGSADICDALYDWLKQDLQANSKPFVFVFGHEPFVSIPDADNGRYRHVGDNLDEHPQNNHRFQQLLRRHKITAYFNGHTHGFSYAKINGLWQIDAGHSRGKGDPGAQSTFLKVWVHDTSCRVDVYRDDAKGGPYSLTRTIAVK